MKQIPKYNVGYDASPEESDKKFDGDYPSKQYCPYLNVSKDHLIMSQITVSNQRFWIKGCRKYVLLKLEPTSKVNIIELGLLRRSTNINRTSMRKEQPGAFRNVETT